MTFKNPCLIRFHGRLQNAIGIMYTITETVEYNSNSDTMQLDLYRGKTLSGNAYDHITDFKVLSTIYTNDDLTRVNNDVNGNPRYVIHFTALITDKDRLDTDITDRYNLAISRAKKLFGGRKFHNKQYGGGIVFHSYNVDTELSLINALHKKD